MQDSAYPDANMEKEPGELMKDAIDLVPLSLMNTPQPETTLVSGRKLALIFTAFMTAFSLVALDQTILSTALPTIASHFQAVNDISWIASAYFLPQAGFMLFFGRVTTIAPAKVIFLVCVGIFELGSLFCAVAPSVNFLIFGRAVAGLGGAGMWVAIMSIIARITTMSQRPVLMGLFGAVYAVASIVGPLLGGVFADHVSWRWCFYINLPLGGIGFVAIIFLLPNHSAAEKHDDKHWWQPWYKLDWIGTAMSVALVVLLLLPLQWGGNEKEWNDPAVIGTFVGFAVTLVAFIVWERKVGNQAILPLKILLRRNMMGAFLEAAMIQIGFVIATVGFIFIRCDIPILTNNTLFSAAIVPASWHSATRSGIDILPFMISGVVATIVSGGVVALKGYIWPFLFFMPFIASVAFGLLFTVSQTTSFARIAGFQILIGIGLGSAIQNTIIVAQAEFAENEAVVPQATSLITFMQLIGSSVGLAATGAVFTSELKSSLRLFASSISAEVIQNALSSVSAVAHLSPDDKILVLKAYIRAVDRVFLIGVPSSALAGIAALLIGRRTISRSNTTSTVA
ncbi:ABC transporter [Cyathus striatus]|nr:ABC transporter [Cyathus striatus]